MSRPIRATVDVAALRHNLAVAQRANAQSAVLAVLKADAYGHGIEVAARAFESADGFALLELDNAVRLRERGRRGPIVLLEGWFEPAELAEFSAHALTGAVHSLEQIAMLEQATLPYPIDVFVKVNSGMNRLGLPPAQLRGALARLRATPNAGRLTLMTHFATADDARGVQWQVDAFARATDGEALPRSVANSATLLRFPELAFDYSRPGIMLYGASPFAERGAAELGLQPAMTLESRVIAVQQLDTGGTVGYGAGFVASGSMRIGVVACGYADGYSRHATTGTPIAVGGTRTRIVGRVSMDMLCVDLTELPALGVGAPVELWGRTISIDEVAAASQTLGYELMCGVAPRVPRFDKT